MDHCQVTPGAPAPLGAAIQGDAVNFALVSRSATRVWLALFDAPEAQAPAREFELDPETYRFGDVWRARVQGLGHGALYLYRLDGPHDPAKGLLFNPQKYVLDPYARAIHGDVQGGTAKCVVAEIPPDVVDARPRVPWTQTVIYEAHVKGMTAHPSSGVAHPGTYRGLIEKIPYLKDLGVTAIELLPIHECGETLLTRVNPKTKEPLRNYWGYNSIGYFAPMARYAASSEPGGQVAEFREMVAAFHEAGIEVILDVVYNHTAEGGAPDCLYCFRGIDNPLYYILDEKGAPRDFTGCGNTLRCHHPVVSDLILDSLRYWITVMGVDGFRFDLATVLNRDSNGHLHGHSALVERINEDPILRGVKLIAEAWDPGGGYQVGFFGGSRWSDWNDRFRDDVRRFWRGDEGTKAAFASRLTGSPDLYQHNGRSPRNCINYITAHDGFTLRDVVSYNRKHNEANGEEGRDGLGENHSWNCGVEGETDDPEVNLLRLRLQKTYLATLFLSLGTPMMLHGDELGRTQRGNNNAYCQDNEISWVDWPLLEQNAELNRFCREIIRFRRENPAFTRDAYYTGQPVAEGDYPDLTWFNRAGEQRVWEEPELCLAMLIHPSQNNGVGLYIMFNATLNAVEFKPPKGKWSMRVNTSLAAPGDIRPAGEGRAVSARSAVVVARRSLVILEGTPALPSGKTRA